MRSCPCLDCVRGRESVYRAAGSGRSARVSQPPDGSEVAHGLGVGTGQAALTVRQVLLVAERFDQGLGAPQVVPGHGGEQVVLDMYVKAAEGEGSQPAAADVA